MRVNRKGLAIEKALVNEDIAQRAYSHTHDPGDGNAV
jgi:hypothetical protein